MKILTITENFSSGGLETRLLSQKKSLKKYGHSNPIYTLKKKSKIRFVRKIAKKLNSERNASFDTYCDLIKNINPDFVDIHPFTTIVPASIAAMKLGKPFGITLHGRPSLTYILNDDYIKKIVTFANVIFYVTESLRADLNIAFPSVRAVFLPNGVNMQKDVKKLDDLINRVIVASRIDNLKIKPILHFINLYSASKVFPKYMTGIDFLGFSRHRDIASLAKKHNINVKFLGDVENATEVMSRYLVVGGMGRVALEAASMNKPVLLLDYKGVAGFMSKKKYLHDSKLNFAGLNRVSRVVDIDKQFLSVLRGSREYMCRDCVYCYNNSDKVVAELVDLIRRDIINDETIVKNKGSYEIVKLELDLYAKNQLIKLQQREIRNLIASNKRHKLHLKKILNGKLWRLLNYYFTLRNKLFNRH